MPSPDMSQWPMSILVVFLSLTLPSPTRGQQRACSTTEAQRADAEADTLRSWDALYQSFKRYAHCDDGGIAEGYSESVARILVDHWDTLSELAALSKQDNKFLRFVLKHVDATLNLSDVEKIRANANSKCPPGLNATCTAIKRKAALKEIDSR
jgi:hypothetical protein